MVQDKAVTSDDLMTVGALSTICDYYGQGISAQELQSKNNFEINWDEWSHLATPGLV